MTNKLTVLFSEGLEEEARIFASFLYEGILKIDKNKVLIFDKIACKLFRQVYLNKMTAKLISLIGQKRFDKESKHVRDDERNACVPYGRCFGISLDGEAIVCNFDIMDLISGDESLVDDMALPVFILQYINPIACSVCPKRSINHCSGCKFQRYCSVECQKKDWTNHKKMCKLVEGKIARLSDDTELKYMKLVRLDLLI